MDSSILVKSKSIVLNQFVFDSWSVDPSLWVWIEVNNFEFTESLQVPVHELKSKSEVKVLKSKYMGSSFQVQVHESEFNSFSPSLWIRVYRSKFMRLNPEVKLIGLDSLVQVHESKFMTQTSQLRMVFHSFIAEETNLWFDFLIFRCVSTFSFATREFWNFQSILLPI